jgi:hypothetical protein
MLTLAMRELVLLGAILAIAAASGKQGSGEESECLRFASRVFRPRFSVLQLPCAFSELLTCKQCIGNAPRCSRTCQGYYCYKSELNISGQWGRERFILRNHRNHPLTAPLIAFSNYNGMDESN